MSKSEILHIKITTLKIDKKDLIRAFQIPENCQITVRVPRGGDYSGCDIVLDEDFPDIEVVWKEEETTKND